ncbi:MAG TPA: diacylglycerol kinase family protein [Burkholderiaceae bacterium]|nr:diacylglycerol kinase family protein [Burkholderiaceae bacterium]
MRFANNAGMDPIPARQTVGQTRAGGPIFVVFNARSGKHDAEDDLITALHAIDRPHRLFTVGHGLSLRRAIAAAMAGAREQDGVVVAAGGDGTINAVAQAVIAADLPFGIVPRGTFNYFGRLHGLPLDADEALRVILGGRIRPVQVGVVNRRYFLVNASLGLYPKLIEDRERFKRAYGRTRLVALWAGLLTLLRERRRMRIRIEAEEESGEDAQPGAARSLQTSTLFVGNNPLQLAEVGIPEARDVAAGKLAAISIKPVTRLEMIGLALRGALGRLADADQVVNFAFRRLEVAPIGRLGLAYVKVATDGETSWMRWPLTFAVSPRPLRLLVP